MINHYIPIIAHELTLPVHKVASVTELLSQGNTIPFIARYRKEATGSLDEVEIMSIRDRLKAMVELDKRREAVVKSIADQGKLTDELKEKIMAAATMTVLEDIYLPYKPKRRTRAMIAIEKGLEPLAEILIEQDPKIDPAVEAIKFVSAEKGVMSDAEALAGARDIIAEWVNEDQRTRAAMRALFEEKAEFISKVIKNKEAEGAKFRDYFEWKEAVKTAPSHRILAMRRGEAEGFLLLRVLPPETDALGLLVERFVENRSDSAMQVKLAVEDCYKRLLSMSMETEIRMASKERADKEAIKVFTQNLRELLMASPLGQKNVLAVDPGFRTGCKVVCLDRQGKLLISETIYPTMESEKKREEAADAIKSLCKKYDIECIAIGNG